MDRFQDITINDASLKALFISYFLNGQYGQAFNLITNNTQLNTKAFVANVMNEIAGILSLLQENFNDEVILYLENQLSGFQIIIDNYLLKNDYDSSTEYQIYNFVIYNDLIYMYINSDPSVGNLPTDTDYWVEIGLLGQKGEPGIGVNLRYTWDSSVTYNPLDVVYYNNELWVATIQNTNVTPGTETTWQTLTGSIVTVDNPGNYYVGDLVVDINPVQDLNGYDSPWPAGGGKNLLSPTTFPNTTRYGVTYTSNADGSITMAGTVTTATWNYNQKKSPLSTYGLASGDSLSLLVRGTNTNLAARFYSGATLLSGGIQAKQSASTSAIAVGSGIVPADATDIELLLYCSINHVPVVDEIVNSTVYPMLSVGSTAPTEWSPYSNICPITGWTGANVTRTGKNVFDGAAVTTTHPGNWGINFSDDTLTITHKNSYSSGAPTLILNLPAGTYVASFASRTKDASMSLYVDGAYSKVLNNGTTFVVESGKAYSVMFAADEGTPNVIQKFQIELGSTATTYEPYTGITIPITFPTPPGTVYGGTLDVTTGELTVTHGFRQFSGAESEVWYYLSLADTFYIYNPTMGTVTDADGICNMFSRKTTWSAPGVRFGVGNTIVYFMGLATVVGSTDPSVLRSWLSENNLQIAFVLATPQTYQLTAQEVQLLAGENNLWADTGNIEVEIVERDWEEFLEFSKASLYIDSTSPSSPFEGMIWFDTSLT